MFNRYFESFNNPKNVTRVHRHQWVNKTEEGVRQESRILKWRRETANGNANLIIGG